MKYYMLSVRLVEKKQKQGTWTLHHPPHQFSSSLARRFHGNCKYANVLALPPGHENSETPHVLYFALKKWKEKANRKVEKKGGYILCVLAVNRASVPCVAHDAIDDLCPICVWIWMWRMQRAAPTLVPEWRTGGTWQFSWYQRGSKLADVDMHAQLVVSSSTPTLTTTEPSLEALAKKKSHYINIYAFSALLSLPCCDKTLLPARLWAKLSESLSNTKHAEIMFHPNSSRSVFSFPFN
jgi:hypothetical protein